MTIHPKVWSLAPWGAALMLFVILVAIDTDMSLLSAVVLAVGVLGWLIAKAFVTVAHVLFGGHVVARILAFGVAVLLFPDMVLALFRAPAALIRYLSQSVPMLATVWPQLQSGDPQSLAVVAKLIDGALASAELPLLQIIFGFVTWVAFGHLLSFVFLHVDKIAATIGTTAKRFPSLTGIAPSVFAAVRSIPSAFWAHTAVIVTLALGVYLILGAIATIPYLSQESAPLEEITARLSTTLDGIQRTEAQFNSRHPLDLPDADPVAELKEFAKTSAPSAGGDLALAKTAGQLNSTDLKGEPRQRSVSFETAFRDALGWRINQLDSIRTDARSRWGRVRQDAWITESKLRPDLQARFASGVSFLRGSNEQTRYLNIVRESYSAELSNIDRMLDVCRNDVQRVDEFARSTSRTTVALVTVLRNQLRSYEDLNLDASLTTTMASALSEMDVATQAPRLDESCKSYTAAVFVPELPQRGQGWGPLANIFDWLLATDSLDVVVIIGMLGAGLFGSAVGTFVTATVRRRTPGIPDGFMSHLIRSFAATMIVYLGLKTGIAFAAVGNPDPDPYLMLFLCFLGTVYSDDVWKWAKRTGANYWTTTQENETAVPRHSTRTSESDSSS